MDNQDGYVTSAFKYSPLAPGWIRLLRLLPNRDSNAPVHCQLFDFPLHEIGEEPCLYEAVSYVWGSSDKPHPIGINGSILAVGANLYAALVQFRDRFLDKILWVDALCINQQDKSERGHQVQHMAKIYHKADRVIVWLGDGTGGGEGAIERISELAADHVIRAVQDVVWSESDLEAAFRLLGRPWFRRVWVLQEVFAARHLRIRCGSAEIDGYAFCTGLQLLQTGGDRQFLDLLHSVQPVIYLMNGSLFRNRRPKDSALPLTTLIDMYHRHEATERHDKVFALLGMSSDDPAESGILPDYFVTWSSLLKKLTNLVFGHAVEVQVPTAGHVVHIHGGGRICGVVCSVRERDVVRGGNDLHTLVIRFLDVSKDSSNLATKQSAPNSTARYQQRRTDSDDGWDTEDNDSEQSTAGRTLENEYPLPNRTLKRPKSISDWRTDPDQPGVEWPTTEWTLRASANAPAVGDFIFQLDGAQQPCMIRPCGDHFTIVVAALSPLSIRTMTAKELREPVDRSATPRLPGFQKTKPHPHFDDYFRGLAATYRRYFVSKDLRDHPPLYLTFLVWDWRTETNQTESQAHATTDLHECCGNHLESFGNVAERRGQAHRLWGSLELIAQAGQRQTFESRLSEMLPSIIRPLEHGEHQITTGMEALATFCMKDQLFGGQRLSEQLFMGVIKARTHQQGLGAPNGLEIKPYGPSSEWILSRMRRIAGALARGESETEKNQILEAEAADLGDESGMKLLLELWGVQVQITPAVLMAAIRCGSASVKKMKLLIEQRGDDFNITETMVSEAVKTDNLALVTLLFNTYGSQALVTEEVIVAAAGEDCSVEMLRLVLDRRGNRVQISERALFAAVLWNRRWRKDLSASKMSLLLGSGENKASVTEKVMVAAAGEVSSVETLRLLLESGDQVQVTEQVLIAALESNRWDEGAKPTAKMVFLLERSRSAAPVTESVIMAALCHDHSLEMIELLLQSGAREYEMVTESVILTAMKRKRPVQLLRILAKHRGKDIYITKGIVQGASALIGGTQLIKLLMDGIGKNLQYQVDQAGIEEVREMRHPAAPIAAFVLERIRVSQSSSPTPSGKEGTSTQGVAKRAGSPISPTVSRTRTRTGT
ncbi:heterokaryon incompatibility protein-domain-containing protein [Echria macrotheca]|uniref:Heterokaryon incompatibility protein-domain-containing protein n=1 Tax=Echria macrotheca TaxID=438768 RepID=A0AAJ0BIM6_9PEZI|nr:heterokaryon incompatibility protein-domain-containing protein [Echria macrotheca]